MKENNNDRFDRLLEKATNVGGAWIVVFGVSFMVLNTLFPIFRNIAFSNWIAGLIIGLFYCTTSILNNFQEYHNDDFPKIYQVWTLLYPVFFLGSILALLYENFVSPTPSARLNWLFGIALAITLCLEIYFDDKYETDEEDS